MNNLNAYAILLSCWNDIEAAKNEINSLRGTDKKISYMTLFALVRACGAIELCIKTILFEFACRTTCLKTQSFIEKRILKSPQNPSLKKISELLKQFDESWGSEFNEKIKLHPRKEHLTSSISSLAQLRNQFAHGQSISTSISNIRKYFADTWVIMKILDGIVR